MKRFVLGCIFIVSLPGSLLAAPSGFCTETGDIMWWNDGLQKQAFMTGQTAAWIEITADTWIPHDPSAIYCNPYVQSEAWIVGEGNAQQVADPRFARVQNRQYGTFYGIYYGQTKHWFVFAHEDGYDYWKFRGTINKFFKLGDRTVADGGDCYCSPIIISLNRKAGYRLTSPHNGVWFDIDGDGELNNIGWTRENDQVGFLVYDRNGNGKIDSGRELFGNATLMADGSLAPNGFAALAELDSSGDGIFTADDAAYAQLRIWIDANHDGKSQRRELLGLDETGVAGVLLGYSVSDLVDRAGNRYYFKGTALLLNQRGVEMPTIIYDVVFAAGGGE
jgi:hypothetical protein